MTMKYTNSHEWINIENDTATVGVTDYAQDQLGDVVYVQLPELGKIIKAGGEIAVLESTKAAADLYAPMSGEVIAVNDRLNQQAELINTSAEKEGWILKLKLSVPQEADALMDASAYQQMIQIKK